MLLWFWHWLVLWVWGWFFVLPSDDFWCCRSYTSGAFIISFCFRQPSLSPWLFLSLFDRVVHPVYGFVPLKLVRKHCAVTTAPTVWWEGSLFAFNLFIGALWAPVRFPTCALCIFGYHFVCFVSVVWYHVPFMVSFDGGWSTFLHLVLSMGHCAAFVYFRFIFVMVRYCLLFRLICVLFQS